MEHSPGLALDRGSSVGGAEEIAVAELRTDRPDLERPVAQAGMAAVQSAHHIELHNGDNIRNLVSTRPHRYGRYDTVDSY